MKQSQTNQRPEHDALADQTIRHYETRAEAFWLGTKDHDVSQNIQALLKSCPETRPLQILDLGCGPGRDLKTFMDLGHAPTGLDACPVFCDMARAHASCPVWHQDFRHLNLPANTFHGIFANASLFHVPKPLLPTVLKQLHDSLKNNGILFSSNPRGNGEGFDGSRYGNYMEIEDYQEFLQDAGFSLVDHYYRPADNPRNEQPWLAVVAKRR